MPALPNLKMRIANEKASNNIRRNSPSSKDKRDQYTIAPWLLALFIFLVSGSAMLQIVRSIMLNEEWNGERIPYA